jgi:hypothetical protein
VADTNKRLQAALDGGATVVLHLCERKPATPEDIPPVALASGPYSADGGTVQVKRAGRATMAVVAWEGEVASVRLPGAMRLAAETERTVAALPFAK